MEAIEKRHGRMLHRSWKTSASPVRHVRAKRLLSGVRSAVFPSRALSKRVKKDTGFSMQAR
ncbi:hypothetical protein ACNFIC_09400 [Pseudomonas sp. NY15463]|uniref:hypothetical protein n=1 Tax=Pseudomonas sp. NY15463 TaxID=3400361 RepID=UPI003A8AB204